MMKKTLLTPLLAVATSLLIATSAVAQVGKFNLTANVGYVYNFSNEWGGGDVVGKANGGLGYGARLGWTNSSGLGLSADYLGFASKWKNDFNVTNNYHVVTFTPSYRFSFGENQEWGLKLGLGVGFSLADVSWIGNKANATTFGSRVAGGAVYKTVQSSTVIKSGCGVTSGGQTAAGRYYADSKGGTGQNQPTLGANQCQESGSSAINGGASDAEIAAEFTVGTGATNGRLNNIISATAVSYSVWRRLFATDSAKAGQFAGHSLETRADYATRNGGTTVSVGNSLSDGELAAVVVDTSTAAVAANAYACILAKGAGAIINAAGVCRSTAEQATDAMELAVANCITSKGSGALVVNGVCRSVAEQATDLALANCITSKGSGALVVNGVCRSVAEQATDLTLANCITSKGAGSIVTALGCRSTAEQATDLAANNCITSKGVGALVVNGLCKSLAELTEAECLAAGDVYIAGVCMAPAVAGKAKDDAGFVLAPEIGLEYDNGVFHADINARYIYELFNVKYDGVSGAADQLQKSGPLAVFIGVGLGVNF